MNTFNAIALSVVVLLFVVVSIVTMYAIRAMELCEDKIQGIVPTSESVRQLKIQQDRAGRTTGIGFLLILLLGMIIAGTLGFPY